MMIALLKTSTAFAATPAIIPPEKNHLCNKTRILPFSEFSIYLLHVHGITSCLLNSKEYNQKTLLMNLSLLDSGFFYLRLTPQGEFSL